MTRSRSASPTASRAGPVSAFHQVVGSPSTAAPGGSAGAHSGCRPRSKLVPKPIALPTCPSTSRERQPSHGEGRCQSDPARRLTAALKKSRPRRKTASGGWGTATVSHPARRPGWVGAGLYRHSDEINRPSGGPPVRMVPPTVGGATRGRAPPPVLQPCPPSTRLRGPAAGGRARGSRRAGRRGRARPPLVARSPQCARGGGRRRPERSAGPAVRWRPPGCDASPVASGGRPGRGGHRAGVPVIGSRRPGHPKFHSQAADNVHYVKSIRHGEGSVRVLVTRGGGLRCSPGRRYGAQ